VALPEQQVIGGWGGAGVGLGLKNRVEGARGSRATGEVRGGVGGSR
jgi:hypothetical protein